MLFPSSGRLCFDSVPASDAKAPAAETLAKMLARENELRLSDESQLWLATHEDDNAEDFYLSLQKRVAGEFGHQTDKTQLQAVQFMRSARALYPDDEHIKNSVLYYKFNRSEQGKLTVGHACPDVDMFTCAGESARLSSYLHESLPTVLVAGSIT